MGETDDSPEEPRDFVLTRLHARYGVGGAPNDLVFRMAPPVSGGRERRVQGTRTIETGATPSSSNSFQGRYVIRHPWTGAIECDKPIRNLWGESPEGGGGRKRPLAAALDTAFAPRGTIELQNLVAQNVPEIAVQQGVPLSPPLPKPADRRVKARGCGCSATDPLSISFGVVVAALCLRRRRRAS